MSKTKAPNKPRLKRREQHTFNKRYLFIPSSADFDVSDDIGGARKEQIRTIEAATTIRNQNQFLFRSYPKDNIDEKNPFNYPFIVDLLEQLGAKFSFRRRQTNGEVKKETHSIKKGQKINLKSVITGDNYRNDTGFSFEDGSTDYGPNFFQRRIERMLININSAKNTDELNSFVRSFTTDPVFSNLFQQSADILDNTKYTLSYQKYMLCQSLMVLQAQAAEIVATLSIRPKYESSYDIFKIVSSEIGRCRKICFEIEDNFKRQVTTVLDRVNQVESSQVARLNDVDNPLSVAEKSPAMEPFESKILTDYQLSEILRREISQDVVRKIEQELQRILGRECKLDVIAADVGDKKCYYSIDIKDFLNDLKIREETKAQEIDFLISSLGSKLDDHILSSDQASLMRQFEEMLLDMNEQKFNAKAFATLATGAGKSFLAEIAKGYREAIIGLWENQEKVAKILQKSRTEYNEEDIGDISYSDRIRSDRKSAAKIALQNNIAVSGIKHGNAPTSEAVRNGFKIDIINLANQSEIDDILQGTTPDEKGKPLKGRVFFIDERLYHKGDKTYTKVSQISRFGGKVILFGANENKMLLHQRLSRLRRKQANLQNQLQEMFDTTSEIAVSESYKLLSPRNVSGKVGDESTMNHSNSESEHENNSTSEEISYEDKQRETEKEYEDLDLKIRDLKRLYREVQELGSKENKTLVQEVSAAHYLWYVLSSNDGTIPLEGKTDGQQKRVKVEKIKEFSQVKYYALKLGLSEQTLEEIEQRIRSEKSGSSNFLVKLKNILSENYCKTQVINSNRSYDKLQQLSKQISEINEKLRKKESTNLVKDFVIIGSNPEYVHIQNNINLLDAQDVKLEIENEIMHLEIKRRESAEKKRALEIYFTRKTKIADAVDALKKIDLREGNIRDNKIGLVAEEKSKFALSEGLATKVGNKTISELIPTKSQDEEPLRSQHIIPGLKILTGVSVNDRGEDAPLSQDQIRLIDDLKLAQRKRGGYLLANFVTAKNSHACVVISDSGEEKFYEDRDPDFLSYLEQISASGSEVTMLYAGDQEYVVGGDYGPLSKLIKSRNDKQYIYITREEDIDINNFEQFIGRNRSSDEVEIEIKIDKVLADRLGIGSKEDLIKFATKNRFKKNLAETADHLRSKLLGYLTHKLDPRDTHSSLLEITQDGKYKISSSLDNYLGSLSSEQLAEIVAGTKVLKYETRRPLTASAMRPLSASLRRVPSKDSMRDNNSAFTLASYELVNTSHQGFTENDLKFTQVVRPYLFYKSLQDQLSLGVDEIDLSAYKDVITNQGNYEFGANDSGLLSDIATALGIVDISSVTDANFRFNISDHTKLAQISGAISLIPYAQKTKQAIETIKEEKIAEAQAELVKEQQEAERESENIKRMIERLNASLQEVERATKELAEKKKLLKSAPNPTGQAIPNGQRSSDIQQLSPELEGLREQIARKFSEMETAVAQFNDNFLQQAKQSGEVLSGVESSLSREGKLLNYTGFEGELRGLREELESVFTTEEYGSLKQRNQSLLEKLKKFQDEIGKREAIGIKQQQEISALRQKIEEAQREKEHLSLEVRGLEEELEAQSSRYKKLSKENKASAAKIAQKRQELLEIEPEIVKLEQELKLYDAQLLQLQRLMAEATNQEEIIAQGGANFEEQIAQLNQNIAQRKSTLSELQDQSDVKKAQLVELQLASAQKEVEIAAAKIKEADLINTRDNTISQIRRMDSEIVALQNLDQEINDNLQQTREKFAELKARFDQYVQTNSGLLLNNTSLEKQLEEKQQEIEAYERELGVIIGQGQEVKQLGRTSEIVKQILTSWDEMTSLVLREMEYLKANTLQGDSILQQDVPSTSVSGFGMVVIKQSQSTDKTAITSINKAVVSQNQQGKLIISIQERVEAKDDLSQTSPRLPELMLKEQNLPIDSDLSQASFTRVTFRGVDFQKFKGLNLASFRGCRFEDGCIFPEGFSFSKGQIKSFDEERLRQLNERRSRGEAVDSSNQYNFFSKACLDKNPKLLSKVMEGQETKTRLSERNYHQVVRGDDAGGIVTKVGISTPFDRSQISHQIF